MGDNCGEMWQYFQASVNDPLSETAIDQFLHSEIPQTEPTRYNTEQGSASGSDLPLHIQGPMMGDMSFDVQGSGPHQVNNMVGAAFTAAVTGRPVPGHDNGIQGFEGCNVLQIESTRHNTEQVFGSGVPQADMVETEATAAVPGRPGQKIKRKINPAERSRKFRVKKKKELDEMKENMQWLQEKNKELEKDLNESNRKVADLLKKIRWFKKTLKDHKKAYDKLQILTNRLSKSLENLSYI